MASYFVEFKISAWAHRRLASMHPYLDGNGRFSQLFGNILLAIGKVQPLVYPNELQP